LMSVQAFGQFEVSPDHFDCTPNKVVRHRTTKKHVPATQSATAPAEIHTTTHAPTAARSRHPGHPSKHAVRRPTPAISQTASTSASK
jgi:hypothetical protein